MFEKLAGVELTLGTGATTARAPIVPSDDLFVACIYPEAGGGALDGHGVRTLGIYYAGRCGGAGQAGGPTL